MARTARAGSRRREPDLGRGDRSLRARTAHGMVVMGASTGGQALLQLGFLTVLARLLTPEDFGVVSGALIIVFLATAIAESGVGQAIIQRAELTVAHMRVGWTLSVLTGLISFALVFVLAPAIEDLLRLDGLVPILRVLAVMFVLNGLTLSDFLLSRRLHFGRLAGAELASYAVGYGGVAVTLALLGFGPWAIVWGQLGQSAMRALLVTVLAPYPYRPSLERRVAGELLNFGAGLTLGRIASWAATQVDNVVVGRYLGAAALGFYGRAYQLVQMPANLFGQVANEVLFPAMAARQDDLRTLRRVFGMGVGVLTALALPVSVLAAATSEPLVRLLLGDQWLPLRAAFDIIIFGLLFRTTSKLTDALMKARGAVYRRAVRNTVFAVLVFVGAYVGQRWGLHGVAVGVLVALGLNYAYSAQLCLRLIEMRWREFAAAHLPALAPAVAAGAIGLGARWALAPADAPPAVEVAVAWPLAILVCLMLVRLAPRSALLRPLARLGVELHATLPGTMRRWFGRVLGGAYASSLRTVQPPDAPADRLAGLAADEHAETRVGGELG
ncbi:lipopolysaccharide biosynthesis protein [Marmoricola endophyticus]|uniref:lipopolysaccharide biosynthesis protein n=1 Tax=Marmoricola endophyticus TaxID=2040280 RepID=UPI0016664193|nr:lipopolysaccharide biosynthesis protein [Marmoricola endophyticus]